jgi:cell pole-organizing protein PopZ
VPSIQDVADQVNAKLDRINEHGDDTVSVAASIRDEIAKTNALLSAQLEQTERLVAKLTAVEQLLVAHVVGPGDPRDEAGVDRPQVVRAAQTGRASR